jgi:hypothetical protein
MLRACALEHGVSWDKSLPYAEFSYNNSYQASLKMSPFEAQYGRKCRTPSYWDQTGERKLFGPEIFQRCRGTSSNNKGEPENFTVKAEKLCGYPKKTARVSGR